MVRMEYFTGDYYSLQQNSCEKKNEPFVPILIFYMHLSIPRIRSQYLFVVEK
jgi:hypothetical protein